MLKESAFNNKRHYTLLRCISWYKQWAWREPQHTGFCVTVHVLARLLLYAAVSRSGYPGADRIQDGGGERVRLRVKERPGHIASNEGTKKKNRDAGVGAVVYRIDRTCYFLDYSRRESRSTVVASRLSPGGTAGPYHCLASTSCVPSPSPSFFLLPVNCSHL